MKRRRIEYRAVERLYHRPTGETIEPGGAVDLAHLSGDEVQLLLDMGAVREATAEELAAPPVTAEQMEG